MQVCGRFVVEPVLHSCECLTPNARLAFLTGAIITQSRAFVKSLLEILPQVENANWVARLPHWVARPQLSDNQRQEQIIRFARADVAPRTDRMYGHRVDPWQGNHSARCT